MHAVLNGYVFIGARDWQLRAQAERQLVHKFVRPVDTRSLYHRISEEHFRSPEWGLNCATGQPHVGVDKKYARIKTQPGIAGDSLKLKRPTRRLAINFRLLAVERYVAPPSTFLSFVIVPPEMERRRNCRLIENHLSR